MSRLLLIEPQTILREAIRRFLSQDHEIHTTEQWTPGGLDKFDVVIADVDALEQRGESVSRLSEALVDAKVPVLWLVGSPPNPTTQGRVRALQKPLERESLRNTLHDLLSEDAEARAASDPQPVIIDLTDVVEAGSPHEEHEKNKK